jgi:hypothetical protein
MPSDLIRETAFSELLARHEELTSRFAKLLHDDAGQVLTAIALRLSVLEVAPGVDAEVKELQKDLDDLLERFRLAQAELGGAVVPKRGLMAAFSQLKRMNPALQILGETAPPWSGTQAQCAFRIVEELNPLRLICGPAALQCTLAGRSAELPSLVSALAEAGGLRIDWKANGASLGILPS